jgi:hypothetical protein
MGNVYCSILYYITHMLALAIEMAGQKRGPEREVGDRQVYTVVVQYRSRLARKAAKA